MPWPGDPLAAVTHADPYAYYAALRARPLELHPEIGLWVAARAEHVAAVLESDAGRVRPPGEPVPRAIADTAAGSVFGRLVRMSDGDAHTSARRIVAAALGAAEPAPVRAASRRLAREQAERLDLRGSPGRVMELMFDLPARVMGGLLGLADESLDRVVAWTGAFVRGIAAGASAERCQGGARAAAELEGALAEVARSRRPGLLHDLARAAERAGGPSPAVVLANGLGFLSQPYEATAGLIGNVLVALARDEALHRRVLGERGRIDDLVQETARHDPSVHNTRRFLARDASIAGVQVREGEAVLVVLAAANRDPALNPDPDAFRLERPGRRLVTFGAGRHACPGDVLAAAITCGVLEALLDAGLPVEELALKRYLPSANVRIPELEARETQRDQ
jgi:cytochrome P450